MSPTPDDTPTPVDQPPGTASVDTAEPSVLARWLAFASIVLAGAAGGFIGWAFVDLQCEGNCTVPAGIGGLVTAVGAAIGVGIVAVLALRALGEWQRQQVVGDDPEGSGLVLRRRARTRPAGPAGKPPRVR